MCINRKKRRKKYLKKSNLTINCPSKLSLGLSGICLMRPKMYFNIKFIAVHIYPDMYCLQQLCKVPHHLHETKLASSHFNLVVFSYYHQNYQ